MERNYTIATLRTIATLLVIILHIAGGYVNSGMDGNNYNFSFWIGNIVDSFSRICVPLFVLISGMFLLGRKEAFLQSYKKRASRIAVPLIVWSIIYVVYKALVYYIINDSFIIIDLAESLVLGVPFYHLWYLYMIIGLYLLIPVLNNLIIPNLSRRSLWTISYIFLAFGVLNVGYNFIFGNRPIFLLWFIDYLGYFLLGYLIKGSNLKIPLKSLSIAYILSSLAIALLSYVTAKNFHNFYFYEYLTPFVIIASLSIYKLFHQITIKENMLSKIEHLTLGVYLIHAGILDVLGLGLKGMNIHIFDNPIIGIPVKFSITFFISLIIAHIFYKTRFLNKTI